MNIADKKREEGIERMLLERKRKLEVSLWKELAKRMKEEQALFASSVRDEGDLSHFDFEQEISRHRMTTANEKLKRIGDALDRLNRAEYGICEECGGAINEKRLKVMPFAAFCLQCQEALEDKGSSERISDWPQEK
jgi:DnaK suppressor protein